MAANHYSLYTHSSSPEIHSVPSSMSRCLGLILTPRYKHPQLPDIYLDMSMQRPSLSKPGEKEIFKNLKHQYFSFTFMKSGFSLIACSASLKASLYFLQDAYAADRLL